MKFSAFLKQHARKIVAIAAIFAWVGGFAAQAFVCAVRGAGQYVTTRIAQTRTSETAARIPASVAVGEPISVGAAVVGK